MIDDSALLRRFCETKSEDAFAEIVRRHVDLVYSVALRQVGFDEHLAKDVAQEVFCDLARKARSLSDRSTLSGWLYRSAQYAANKIVRTERRRRQREERAMIESGVAGASEAEPDWDKLRPWLDEAIGALHDKDRDAVCLRYFESRSYAEIGDRLSLSENAARMRVDRAVDKLRGFVSKRGVSSTGAALAAALGGQAGHPAPAGLVLNLTQAGITAACGGTGGLGIAAFMNILNTGKLIAAAALVVAMIVGLGIQKSGALRAVHARLASLDDQSRENEVGITALETRLEAVARASDSSGLGRAAENRQIRSGAVRSSEEISEAIVEQRLREARELKSAGRDAEALALFLGSQFARPDYQRAARFSLGPQSASAAHRLSRSGTESAIHRQAGRAVNRTEKLDILNRERRTVERFEIDTRYDEIAARDLWTEVWWQVQRSRDLFPRFQAEESDVPVVLRSPTAEPVALDSGAGDQVGRR